MNLVGNLLSVGNIFSHACPFPPPDLVNPVILVQQQEWQRPLVTLVQSNADEHIAVDVVKAMILLVFPDFLVLCSR